MSKRTAPLALLVLLLVAAACTSPQQPSTPSPVAKTTAAPQATAAPTEAPKPTATATAKPSPTQQATATAVAKVDFSEISFEQVVTTPNTPPHTLKLFLKQGKMRAEVQAEGQQMIWIGDNAAKVAYMWLPAENVAMKVPLEQFEEQVGGEPEIDVVARQAMTGKLVGSETIDGKVCDVYEYETPDGKAKAWLWREKAFPLRVEVTGAGGKVVSEMKNVQFGNVPDNLFQLPAGVQVMDFGALPGLMPTPGR